MMDGDSPTKPTSVLRPRRKLWLGGLLILLVGPCLASMYGYWLSTDSVRVEFPVDAVVVLGGYNRHELAAQWIETGRCQEVWIFSSTVNPLAQAGLTRPPEEVHAERLRELGVAPEFVRQFSIDCKPRDVPAALRAIDHTRRQLGARQIVVTCQSLEVQFLRQIANAALSNESAASVQFVELPNDRYASTRWWISRTGLKDAWNQTMQLLSNWSDGPTGGFEEVEWDPWNWEPPRPEVAP